MILYLKLVSSEHDRSTWFIYFQSDDPDRIEQAKIEAENLKKFQILFKGLKFFINREVPKETFVFIIR